MNGQARKKIEELEEVNKRLSIFIRAFESVLNELPPEQRERLRKEYLRLKKIYS